MTEPIFDHEKLDVYRLSIEFRIHAHRKSESSPNTIDAYRPPADRRRTKP
jgi:hypothetical protein